ncbi:hypothetical protein GCM10010124_09320 [Pilimelia terevasa]|uniref:GGDEF domain-containing protein n=1 Tax=Pilimelia terevasa TaxID=53372 RepID=A0A8J3FIF9_9ACTN|nr:GGDEF domain-containing protein [Pilimelia terevasa]GGK18845.1 hypothetical protein GCM10010124_09320 [Pilimelia terevasa]
MGWLDRVADQVDALTRARQLQVDGRSADACLVVDRVLAGTHDPHARADALVQRLGILHNLGRTAAYREATEAALAAAEQIDDPYLHGHLHALASLTVQPSGLFERAVTHLVHGARFLNRMTDADGDAAAAWHDLAAAYSHHGFHRHALSALAKAREVGEAAGMPPETLAAPAIRLRGALALDHRGDTDGCVRILSDLAVELGVLRHRGGVARLRPTGRTGYGYALARLAALGGPPAPDAGALLASGGTSPMAREIRQLGEVCLAVNSGFPIEALTRLDGLSPQTSLGGPEPLRLRSLACQRAGDHAGAHEADRAAFRMVAAQIAAQQEGYVEGLAARLAHEELRHTVARYADEALTDPLTGLPNRRHLERYVASTMARGAQPVIGVCDLDGFKAVNTVHGHLAGDLVLQRIAGVLARVMRAGDFVARYGGDEFVVMLPAGGTADTVALHRRIVAAVAAEDWEALVPGTPVGVTVGWAEVTATDPDALPAAIIAAFETADRAMLHAKRQPRPRAPVRTLHRGALPLSRAAGDS